MQVPSSPRAGGEAADPDRTLDAAARPVDPERIATAGPAVVDEDRVAESTADGGEPSRGLVDKPWFWAPILPLLALDLWSKWWVFSFLEQRYPSVSPHGRRYSVLEWPVNFDLVQYVNTGTVWGLAQDFTEALIALRVAALFVLGWFAWRTPAGDRLRLFVLGMIVAGAAGNLWDNLTEIDGGVRDFLLFSIRRPTWEWAFPAFNVADSCITVGAVTLAILVWRDDRI